MEACPPLSGSSECLLDKLVRKKNVGPPRSMCWAHPFREDAKLHLVGGHVCSVCLARAERASRPARLKPPWKLGAGRVSALLFAKHFL